MKLREYNNEDLKEITEIWNEVVRDGVAFPQEEELTPETAETFFGDQTSTVVSVSNTGEVTGLYILHPNNVGRVGHIANASYAVSSKWRGQKIGKALVKHSLKNAKDHGFKILQFNAVVATNNIARNLYKELGFKELGCIPKGFKITENYYEDIYPYIYDLDYYEKS